MTRKKSDIKCPNGYHHSVYEDYLFNVSKYCYCQECKQDVHVLIQEKLDKSGNKDLKNSIYFKFNELSFDKKYELVRNNPDYQYSSEYQLLPSDVKDEFYRIYRDYFKGS